MPLGKVFDLIFEKENGGQAVDSKADNNKLKSWFEEILPEYSKDKVYTSDIKKVAQWYNTLQKLDLLIREENDKEETVKTVAEPPVAEKKKKKPAPKAKAK